jgi:cytoskeletal protein CcmA (bactofilin family)
LVVRAGGRVTGDICYGEIEIEKGAQVTGALSVREARSEAPASNAEFQRNAA